MERVTEPEVMDGEEQAAAYAGADFSASNRLFVDLLVRRSGARLRSVLDIGCGPGDVPVLLAMALPRARITAVDASGPMVRLAREAVLRAGLEDRVTIVPGRFPALDLGTDFDAIVSKDFLHHLPDPMVYWNGVKRLAGRGVVSLTMDLWRPETPRDVARVSEEVCGRDHPKVKEDLYHSLFASHTVEEVRSQLERAGLRFDIERPNARHYVVSGVF